MRLDSDRKRVWRPYLHTAGVAILLALLAIWNGYPLLYEDTEAYISRPAALLGSEGPAWLASEWSERSGAAQQSGENLVPGGGESTAAGEGNSSWLAGRSVYWGTLAYLLVLSFGVWGVLALNALCSALVICLLWFRVLRQMSALRLYVVAAALAAFSYVGVFTALMMPDILAAVLIVGMSMLVAAWKQLRRLDRAILVMLCIFAALSHDSILLIAAVMAGIGLIARILAVFPKGIETNGQVAAVFFPVVGGVLGLLVFNWVAIAETGQPPLRYPFLSAHLTSLESGQRHLRNACPEADYALCAYRNRLPVRWTTFIFSQSPETGVFATASPDTKRKLADEQYRFAMGVAVDQPVLMAVELAGEAVHQLSTFDLDDLRQSAKRRYFEANFPSSVFAEAQRSHIWAHPSVLDRFATIQTITAALSLAAMIILAVLRAFGWVSMPANFWSIALLILVGVVANAAICGILVSPWGRFQARVVWLVTLLGMTAIATARVSKPQVYCGEASYAN